MLHHLFEWKIPLILQKNKKQKLINLSSFIKRLSTLLNEGYTLTEAINMLLPHHVENADDLLDEIDEKLRKGVKIFELFQTFYIPQTYLIMIKVADEIGTLSMTLSNIAEQMEFEEKMKKKLRKTLTYPIFLLIFLMSLFISFRIFFLPNIEQILFSRSEMYQSNFTMTKLLFYLPDILLLITFIISVFIIVALKLFNRNTVEQKILILKRIPILNYFFRLHITKIFAKSLGDLLAGGFSLQHSLKILREQQLNSYMAYIVEKIENHIIFGEALSKAVVLTDLFYKKFEDFIEHGEQSGYLGRELIIYYELLEEKYRSITKTALTIVQPAFFILIAICIVSAYLSILLPMYNLIEIV